MEAIVEVSMSVRCKVQPGSFFEQDGGEDLKDAIQTQLEIHPQLYDVTIEDLVIQDTEEVDEDGCESEEEEE